MTMRVEAADLPITIEFNTQMDENRGTAIIFTCGMSEVGLPEIVMLDVPFCFLELAEGILLHLATIMYQRRESGREIEEGELLDLAGLHFQLLATEPVNCERCGPCAAWMARSLPPVDLASDLIPHA